MQDGDQDQLIRKYKRKKKSFRRRAKAKLGLRHITIKTIILYICIAILLVFLVRPAISYITTFITYFVKQQFMDNAMKKGGLEKLRKLRDLR